MVKKIFTHNFLEPFNGERTAVIDIHAGDGNLAIEGLTGNEQTLAEGTLQYFENKGFPSLNLTSSNGQASLKLKGGRAGRPWFHLPWSACNGATEWHIHINSAVSCDITAHSDGGNVKLDLSGMAVSCIKADTGGGNVDVVLPDEATDLSVTAQTGAGNITIDLGSHIEGSNNINAHSGAGNVVVNLPGGMAARIHTTTGLGKAIMDPLLNKIGDNVYQSPGYENAVNKVEVAAHSGAGNVIVNSR